MPQIIYKIQLHNLTRCRIIVAVIRLSVKTNAIRMIEKAGIPYKEATYQYDENDLNGNHAAKAIGFSPEQVYKTLVARGAKTGIQIFCIPVCSELDLKKAAKAAGDKSIALIPVKELLSITGYIRGGCSPVGMKKNFPTHFHEECILFDEIAVSAGERGHQMILSPDQLVSFLGAKYCDLTTK